MADKRALAPSKCSTCSQEVLEGLLFCTSCGAATELGKAISSTFTLPCPNCQAIDSLSSSFCVSCGSRVDTVEARDKARALMKRSGLNWRSNALIAARKPDPPLPPPEITRHPESVAIPAALGILAGAGIVVAAVLLAESSLNYLLARAASPERGLVMFVRLAKTESPSNFFAKQERINVSFSPLDSSAPKKTSEKPRNHSTASTAGAEKHSTTGNAGDANSDGPFDSKHNGPPADSPFDSSSTAGSSAAKQSGSSIAGSTAAKPNGSSTAGATAAKPNGSSASPFAAKPNGSPTAGSTAAKPNGSSTANSTAAKPNGSSTADSTAAKPNGSSTADSTAAKPNGSSTSGSIAAKQGGTAGSTTTQSGGSAQRSGTKKSESGDDADKIIGATDEFGMLKMPELPAGTYKVSISADGYYTAVSTVEVKNNCETIVGWPKPIVLLQASND